MLICDLKTQDALTKQEIHDTVEKSHEWKGISMDYPGGVYYRYRIVKDKDIYKSSVSDGNLTIEASYAKDFDMAFSLLGSLQNCIIYYFKRRTVA